MGVVQTKSGLVPEFCGLSIDHKPEAPAGAVFHELDTDKAFRMEASGWAQIDTTDSKSIKDLQDDIAGLPQWYDSTGSLDALCTALATALGTALGGTFTITRGAYNATTKKYAWTATFVETPTE